MEELPVAYGNVFCPYILPVFRVICRNRPPPYMQGPEGGDALHKEHKFPAIPSEGLHL